MYKKEIMIILDELEFHWKFTKLKKMIKNIELKIKSKSKNTWTLNLFQKRKDTLVKSK
jgi:hypothetical protein